jgi:hypothetical protein
MARYLISVECNCSDPKREGELHEWYNNTHIPDVLETDGFISATRYELVHPVEDKGKFLAVYEIETDDFEAFEAKHGANMKRKMEQNRFTDLVALTSRGVYKQVLRLDK